MSKIKSEEVLFSGPRFEVKRKTYMTEDGKEYLRDCIYPGDAVSIIALTDSNEVLFIKQLREVIDKVTWELPAGRIEEGEDPKETALRELEEETGYKAGHIEHLITTYMSAGYTSEKLHIYYAKELSEGHTNFDEDENILQIEKIPLEECLKMVERNEFEHANINIAILLYYFKYIK